MRLRSVVLAVALITAVTVTATGTQSISASQLDRGISVSVASDERAYLGVTQEVVSNDDGRTLFVEVTNNVPGGVPLDIAVVHHNGTTSAEQTTTVMPGVRQTLQFDSVSCDGSVDITATGQTVQIELSRAVPCDDSQQDDNDDDGDEDDNDDDGDEDDNGDDGDEDDNGDDGGENDNGDAD